MRKVFCTGSIFFAIIGIMYLMFFTSISYDYDPWAWYTSPVLIGCKNSEYCYEPFALFAMAWIFTILGPLVLLALSKMICDKLNEEFGKGK